MASGPAVVVPSYDGKPRSHAGDVERVRCVLDHQLVAARLWRRQKISAWVVRKVVVVAEHSYEFVDPIVIRRDVLVPNRPVVAESVTAPRLEIVGSESERDASPV